MEFLRKFGLWLSGLLLIPLLLYAIFTFIFLQTIGSATYIKSTLQETSVYEAFGVYAQEQLKTSPDLKNNTQVKKALKAALQEKNTRAVVEDTVDQTFLVLNGDLAANEMVINISPVTDAFQTSLETQLKSTLKSLPTCTTFAEAQAQTADPFNATCLPPGVSTNQLTEQALTEVLYQNKTFKTGEIKPFVKNSAQEKDTNGQASAQTETDPKEGLELLGTMYRLSKIMMPIMALLSIVAVTGLILLSRPRLAGVKRAGWLLAITGLLMTVTSFFLGQIARNFARERTDTNSLAAAGEDAGRLLAIDATNLALIIGVILLIIGLAMTITSMIYLKKRAPQGEKSQNKPQNPPEQQKEPQKEIAH